MLTDDTGTFWFFDPKSTDLGVKVLDGGALNRHLWLFYGALSNVEYVLDVVDTATGESRVYHNPSGELTSHGDTTAFAAIPALARADGVTFEQARQPTKGGAATCAASSTVLCLNDGRFRVEVEWEDFLGARAAGHAVARTANTGTFWFFNDRNVELLVKVLDGRPVNGYFWLFYGALTNVGYTVTVTDTETGAVKVYDNPSGEFRSRADTTAF